MMKYLLHVLLFMPMTVLVLVTEYFSEVLAPTQRYTESDATSTTCVT